MAFLSRNREEKELENLPGYPEFLRILLLNRNLKNKAEAEAFLSPNYEMDMHDPFLLPDMEKAVERILQAIEKQEKIVIFSDYDADGIPGGVILHDLFKKLEYENFINYIPHRHNEGFGLNIEAVDKFKEEGVALIITVDCGITDLVEAELIKKHNIDLIVTDHHEPKDILPEAVAVIDAKRKDSKYPFADLCGAGVAFKLAQAVLMTIKNKKKQKSPSSLNGVPNRYEGVSVSSCSEIIDGWEKWLLDMACIATLSDMVPLVGENRAIAYFGLKVLRKSPRPGLQKLLSLLKINQKQLSEDDIGFSISPRINAASRIGDPEDAFKLFIAKDEVEADIYARHLDKINNERKGIVASIVKEVRKIMFERYENDSEEKKVIVIGNPDWRPSLLGLVANSLVDDHARPVFLWGRDGENILKGSCRGDGCTSVLDLMNSVEENILQEFGGHSMSGGFSVVQDKVHLLEEKLQIAYEKIISISEVSIDTENEIRADTTLTLDEVTLDNYKMIEKLAPFGFGNPKPVFLFENILINELKAFGKEKNHLELIFSNSQGRKVKAIGFFMANLIEKQKLDIKQKINLLANFENSTFAGRIELRLRIVDLEIVL